MTDEATAFVPGHVTGFFSPHPADDPQAAGSRGAGLTLSDGVEVTVRRTRGRGRERGGGGEVGVRLNGERVDVAPVGPVLAALDVAGDARVDAVTPLPLGSGFGVSGALALGTAFAANAAFERARSENELVAIAHAAEVRAGTGLGDVVAQSRGGLPIRLDPGGPDHGRLDAVPDRARVEYVSFGGRSTEAVLAGDTDRLREAGATALARLTDDPTLARLMSVSRRFAREAELSTDRVESAVGDVADAGGDAAMAMLGETVFALGSGLTDAGYDAAACRTHASGATLRDDPVGAVPNGI